MCGLWFHRGDVSPARQTVVRHISEAIARDSLRWDRTQERPFYTRGFARSTPLQHAVRWKLTEEPSPVYPPASPLDAIVSDTGELEWRHADTKRGLVSVDSPCAQGLIGFVRHNPRPLSKLRATVGNDFCVILCTSLDDRPIADSSRLLLAAMARVENSEMKWEYPERTLSTVPANQPLPDGTSEPYRSTLPLLVQAPHCLAAVAESDLLDWAGMFLTGTGSPTIGVMLAPRNDGRSCVVSQAPRVSPWRVVMIARSADDLVGSDLIANLATPCRLDDTSWIQPGLCAWDPVSASQEIRPSTDAGSVAR